MQQLSKQDILDSIETHKKCIAECEAMIIKMETPKQTYRFIVEGFLDSENCHEFRLAFQTLVDLSNCEGHVKWRKRTHVSNSDGKWFSFWGDKRIYAAQFQSAVFPLFSTEEFAEAALNKIGQDRVKQMLNVFYGE